MADLKLTELGLYALTALYGLVTWNGSRVVKRVDKHEDNINKKVDRDEFNNTVTSVRNEISKGNDRISDKLDKMTQLHQNQISELTKALLRKD